MLVGVLAVVGSTGDYEDIAARGYDAAAVAGHVVDPCYYLVRYTRRGHGLCPLSHHSHLAVRRLGRGARRVVVVVRLLLLCMVIRM